MHPLKYVLHKSSVLLVLGAVSHVFTTHLVAVESETHNLPSDVLITLSQFAVYLSHVFFADGSIQPIPSNMQPVFPVLQSYSFAGEVIAPQAVTVHFPVFIVSSIHLPSDPIYYEHELVPILISLQLVKEVTQSTPSVIHVEVELLYKLH